MDVLGAAGRLLSAGGAPPDELVDRLNPEARRTLARTCMRGMAPRPGDTLLYRIPMHPRWPVGTTQWRPALVLDASLHVGVGQPAWVTLSVTLNPFIEGFHMTPTSSHDELDVRNGQMRLEYRHDLERYGLVSFNQNGVPTHLAVHGAYEGDGVGQWRWP